MKVIHFHCSKTAQKSYVDTEKEGKLIVEIFALSVMKVAMALVFPILSLRISPNIFICLFMPTTIFILIPDIYKYNCSKLL